MGIFAFGDLQLSAETRPIGKWGRMRRDYLKEFAGCDAQIFTDAEDRVSAALHTFYLCFTCPWLRLTHAYAMIIL